MTDQAEKIETPYLTDEGRQAMKIVKAESTIAIGIRVCGLEMAQFIADGLLMDWLGEVCQCWQLEDGVENCEGPRVLFAIQGDSDLVRVVKPCDSRSKALIAAVLEVTRLKGSKP